MEDIAAARVVEAGGEGSADRIWRQRHAPRIRVRSRRPGARRAGSRAPSDLRQRRGGRSRRSSWSVRSRKPFTHASLSQGDNCGVVGTKIGRLRGCGAGCGQVTTSTCLSWTDFELTVCRELLSTVRTSLAGGAVRLQVTRMKASVKPTAWSTSSRMSVIRTSGRRRYRSRLNSSAAASGSAADALQSSGAWGTASAGVVAAISAGTRAGSL